MRVIAVAILCLSVSAYAGKGKDPLRPAYARARALVRAQPLPEALRKEILGRMKLVKGNLAKPGTRIEYNDVFGKDAAFIELDHGSEASELSVSTLSNDGHVILGRDRLGWKFFPAGARGTAQILRVDRGYGGRGAEWYRITGGQATAISKAEGAKLEQAHHRRWTAAEMKRLTGK
jgi:hypothetical protein